MSADQRLTKVYSDQIYKFTTVVRHQGVVIAFAMDQARRIYYSVLDLREGSAPEGRTDADFWSQDPRELRFPTELTEVGYSAAGNALMPTVALGGRIETSDSNLFPEEIDPFLSSTARLSADCPFCVYSDGAHVFLFRQAVAADHPDAVLRLQSGATSGDSQRQDLLRDAAGAKVAVANASLLCDRFLLLGGQLQPATEIRFRRSRHKTLADSARDSLGSEDMNGNYFQEPTQHLSLVRNLKDGQFCVLQLPTGMPDVKRWQIFALNSRTARLDSFNIERDSDGLFNTQGTQAYTSPDPQYRDSVYEREPGLCPFTQRELVPILSDDGFADAGLLLDGTGSVTIASAAQVLLGSKPFTIEAWLRPDQLGPSDRYLVSRTAAAMVGGQATVVGFALSLDAQGRPAVRKAGGGVLAASTALPLGQWTHVAVTFDGTSTRFFVNGEAAGQGDAPEAEAKSALVVGAAPGVTSVDSKFKGMLDEVRLWSRARGGDEIRRDRSLSLVGQEPGLVAYYRCDEGAGTALYDQTDNAQHGALTSVTWATSEAHVGSHPGVRRDSFRFTGRTTESPPAAVLYHQQEPSGPGGSLLKRQARLLLTCALGGPGPDGAATPRRYVAALDFAVDRDGALAQIPDEVSLDFIDAALKSATLDEISAVEQEITRLQGRVAQGISQSSALSFNGVSDSVSCGSKLRLDNSDFTIEFWVQRRQPSTRTEYVFQHGPQENGKCLFFIFYPNDTYFGFWGCDLAGPGCTDTEWHHWACTYSRATGQRVMYRDGVQVAADVAAVKFTGSGELLLGTAYWGWIANICLDELRVWTRVRSVDEICADLNRRMRGDEPNLAAYYTFSDRQLRDRSGHGNDGVVKGGNPTVTTSVYRAPAQVDQVKLDELQRRLALMSGGLRGGEVAVHMPLLCTDRNGLGILGGLLGFAYSSHSPTLLSSVTGDVNVYFRGDNGLFYAAYYDTTVSRHAMTLGTGARPLRFTARAAGLDLAQTTVKVIDGSSAATCTVQIVTSRMSETWPDVPRQAQRFADVFNGLSEGPAGYDYRQARCSIAGGDLSGGSLTFLVSDIGASATVDNGEASASSLASTPRFWSDAPGRAYDFDGQRRHLTLPAAQLGQVELAGPTTIEAWVNAPGVKQRSRILHANTPASQYTLGLEAEVSQDALSFNGTTDYVTCGSKMRLDNTDLTIEFWVKRQQTDRTEYVFQYGPQENSKCLFFIFHATENYFGFWGADLKVPGTTNTDWHHWACTYNRATRQRVVYRDGVQVAADVAAVQYAGTGEMLLGRAYWDWPANILLDEFRVWTRVRSGDEIRADLNRRLRGDEPGLLAYYVFTGRDLRDRSGHGNDGAVKGGNPGVATSILAARSYQVFAGVGASFVRTRETIASEGWNHLAASFNQSWALQFNGASTWLNAGAEEALNLGDELTVEVFLRLDQLGRAIGVLSKGRAADGTEQRSPYQITITAEGKIVFSFESRSGQAVSLSSSEAIVAGAFYRIAAVRKNSQQLSASGVETWQDLLLYLNGREVGRARYDGEGAGRHSGALEIGRAVVGRSVYYLPGVISEVRLWSAPRAPRDLGGPINGQQRDLVARFPFEENRGNITRDVAGGREARIYGARWTRNPDPNGSALILYVNGITVATAPVPMGSALITDGPGDLQFTLGAMRKGGKPQDAFCGVLEEVRVWRTRRSAEQIQDNLFTRLRGERQDLMAYYTFDADSTLPQATRLRDEGPRSNHLPLPGDDTRPAVVLSTAPVQSDTAQVRGALAGVKTAFHESIDCAPAVAEYGAMSRDGSGGTMKRCYSMVQSGTWQIVASYKVGDLITEWVGQAQFDPQVLGFVEGAPPVPGENLVAGPLDPEKDDGNGASTLTFTQADQTVSSVSSSSEASLRVGMELGVSLDVGADIFLVTAPLGIGTMEPLLHFAAAGSLKVALDFEHSWSNESVVSQEQSAAKALTVGLSGFWQKAAAPGLGRRFALNNSGFALVQSATADIFALRLAHSGALVSYRMRPNPDIPRDWNIIPFPINPYYVKQGTLDGCAGMDASGAKLLDPSYPQASAGGEYSYFKPREAYALKRQILREQQRVQGTFARASTNPFDRASPLVKEAVDSLGPAANGGSGGAPVEDSLRRSIVNTYVWTAEGGFFAESTDTLDSFQESATGSYSFSASLSMGRSLEFEVGDVGVTLEGDATFGGGFSETRTRSRGASRSFGVEVACSVPGDLQLYSADGAPVFDAHDQPVKAPGRVDGYRWMTFLLGSSANNYDDLFRKVIDPTWLKQSKDPSAVALRQAQQSDKRPPCWRILHRVTYVSRVLPNVPAADAPPVERAMQAENIASNWELIKRLSPYVATATGSYGDLALATREALAQELPGLVPHADQITRYLALYHGILPS